MNVSIFQMMTKQKQVRLDVYIPNKSENATHVFLLKNSSYFIFLYKMKLHMKVSFFGFHLTLSQTTNFRLLPT